MHCSVQTVVHARTLPWDSFRRGCIAGVKCRRKSKEQARRPPRTGTRGYGRNVQSLAGRARRRRFRPSARAIVGCQNARTRDVIKSMRLLILRFQLHIEPSRTFSLPSRITFLKTASKLPKRATMASPSRNSLPSCRSSAKHGAPSSFYPSVYVRVA